jgi:hypothetical protein
MKKNVQPQGRIITAKRSGQLFNCRLKKFVRAVAPKILRQLLSITVLITLFSVKIGGGGYR